MREGVKEVVAEQVPAVEVEPTKAAPQVVGAIAPKEESIAERTKVADAKVALPLATNGQAKTK